MDLILPVIAAGTGVSMGGTSVDLSSATSVQGLISSALTSIHIFALTIALCIFLYAVVRNYAQFGEHIGVRFIAALLTALVMIFAFPKICDAVQQATQNYSQGTSQAIETMFCWLIEQKVNSGKLAMENMSLVEKIAHLPESLMHSIQAAMCNIFYVNGIWLGKSIRDIVYFIFQCLYHGALCLSPMFFAALLIPEIRQLGVNFITSCLGLALMPLCFLFGDLCNIWLADHMWSCLGLGDSGMFWSLVRTGAAVTAPVGTVLAYIAFGIIYAILATVVYVVLPFLYMRLFKAGAAGSPVGFLAAAIGKAVHTAVLTVATVATAGAAGAEAKGASDAKAAQSASRSAKSSGGSDSDTLSAVGGEIDGNME